MRAAEFERKVWILDQQINDRGFCVDTVLAKKAAIACQQEKVELDEEVAIITQGEVTSGTQVAKLRAYLSKLNVDLPNMQAKTLELVLEDDDIEGEARQLLEARQRVSKSSTAKFLRILSAIGPDKRMRGGLQYCGASRTGRWAGRLFQPHNLPRPSRKWAEVKKCIKALLQGYAHVVSDNVHQLCSDIARSIIVAAKGHKLLVADYASIEGRVLAWIAREMSKLTAYRNEEDQYVRTYCKMFGLPYGTEIPADDRQKGKCFELSMGYEGGVMALIQSAKTYNVDLIELGEGTYRNAPSHIRSRARKNFAFAIIRKDPAIAIGRKLYIQLECAKLMWRATSPATVQLWKTLNLTAIEAIENPGKRYRAAKCLFMMVGDTLAIKLPSGRCLLYSRPRVSQETKKGKKTGRKSITYVGVYGSRESLYGGKLAENITSGISRDILAHAMLKVDAKGYPIILTVHDEIVAEVKRRGRLTLKWFLALMLDGPRWIGDLPLAIDGYEAVRYRKN